jgi:hypothetical protein
MAARDKAIEAAESPRCGPSGPASSGDCGDAKKRLSRKVDGTPTRSTQQHFTDADTNLL